MDRFILLCLVIALGCIPAGFWYQHEYQELPIWIIVIACAAIALIFIRIVELALKGTVAKLTNPDTQKKLKAASDDAAEKAVEAAKQGTQTAQEVGNSLVPRLQYLFSFSGRSTRGEYLLCQIGTGVAMFLSLVLLLSEAGILPLIVLLASAVILLAFGVRRTRDTGVSQWWFLLILVPPANLAMFVFLLLVPTDEFKGKGF
ncbi:DUF805 domain-containing protein [Leisingera thetidis]|uniref:DUF805 domain-containing protein n=1 Tax=Leisingera thetidis TaxID=2930199 RepID=UPI0021F7A921|nr:DUF805 domain-containing protein [Leisingera thetidis]